jgi:transcriptional regulator with XRE-family HTH domain
MQNVYISKRIKDLCKEKSISVATFLSDNKLSKGLIYELEKRNVTPSIDTIAKIADYFNCTIDSIVREPVISYTLAGDVSADPLVITEDEYDVLRKYRQLPDKAKGKLEERLDQLFTENFKGVSPAEEKTA